LAEKWYVFTAANWPRKTFTHALKMQLIFCTAYKNARGKKQVKKLRQFTPCPHSLHEWQRPCHVLSTTSLLIS